MQNTEKLNKHELGDLISLVAELKKNEGNANIDAELKQKIMVVMLERVLSITTDLITDSQDNQ